MISKANNIVVEAKHQYTTQLIDTLSPFIYQGFKTIFNSCKESPSSLKKFQEKICNVTKWNQDIIDTEYQRIIDTSKCVWIDKLIEVIFIYNVKILTTISDNKKTFNIKIPEVKNFIHKCYIETARNLYIEPYVINDSSNSFKKCMEIISSSIEKTIINLIPQQEIIEKCLSNDTDTTDTTNNTDNTDTTNNTDNTDTTNNTDNTDTTNNTNNTNNTDNIYNEAYSDNESNQDIENEENEWKDDTGCLDEIEENSDEFKDIESASNNVFMKEPEPLLDIENDICTQQEDCSRDDDIPFFSDEE